MLQLERLAGQVQAEYFAASSDQTPALIARAALERAKSGVFDALIVDTAGRLHVDASLMAEVRDIDAALASAERCSWWTPWPVSGTPLNAARASARRWISPIILTKADGMHAGGAALSVAAGHRKPIVFHRVGERPSTRSKLTEPALGISAWAMS